MLAVPLTNSKRALKHWDDRASVLIIRGAFKAFNEKAYKQAMKLTGFKGYVTNIPVGTMPAAEAIGSDHDLWHVEQSFRMSKKDLRARTIFHRKSDAIETHLTAVLTALAVSRLMQDATGASLKKIITSLRTLREFTGRVGGHNITFDPGVTGDARESRLSYCRAGLRGTKVVELRMER